MVRYALSLQGHKGSLRHDAFQKRNVKGREKDCAAPEA
jgi:hypothetical protein